MNASMTSSAKSPTSFSKLSPKNLTMSRVTPTSTYLWICSMC